MAKRKESAIWWLIKFIFKGIYWVVKKIFSFLYLIFAFGAGFVGRKIRERKERAKLESNPFYKSPAKSEDFIVHKKIAGDFNYFEKRLQNESLIALIFGKRGSGKTALGFRIVENIHDKTRRKAYALGVRQEVLPSWIESINDIEKAKDGSVILVDEGAVEFNARSSMSNRNKELAGIMATARHKSLTLLFITQNTGMLDRNVLKLADTLIVKEGSLLQLEMERSEIRKFYAKAKEKFDKLKGEKRNYSYLIDSDFEGVVEHRLPSFWSEEVSRNKGSV